MHYQPVRLMICEKDYFVDYGMNSTKKYNCPIEIIGSLLTYYQPVGGSSPFTSSKKPRK
jgi:hypothetical protein